MGLETKKLDGFSMVGWNSSGWVPGACLIACDGCYVAWHATVLLQA
jgi:hypothetical protein